METKVTVRPLHADIPGADVGNIKKCEEDLQAFIFENQERLPWNSLFMSTGDAVRYYGHTYKLTGRTWDIDRGVLTYQFTLIKKE